MHAGCWVWCWWCIIIPGDGTSLSLSEYWLDSAWRHWLQWVPLSWVITSGAQNLRLRPLCDTECDRWLHNNVILITPLWSACPQLPSDPRVHTFYREPGAGPATHHNQCSVLSCTGLYHTVNTNAVIYLGWRMYLVVLEWMFCLVYSVWKHALRSARHCVNWTLPK